MIFIKLLIISLIIYVCSYLGFLKSKAYENRVISLKKFEEALCMFKTKIEFTYEPIKDIFEDISLLIYQDKENIFKKASENMKTLNLRTSWYDSVDTSAESFLLEDKNAIKALGKLLGKTDKTGQIREITLVETLIKAQIEKAEIEKNKNVKLYKTLGTVSGIGISIILI